MMLDVDSNLIITRDTGVESATLIENCSDHYEQLTGLCDESRVRFIDSYKLSSSLSKRHSLTLMVVTDSSLFSLDTGFAWRIRLFKSDGAYIADRNSTYYRVFILVVIQVQRSKMVDYRFIYFDRCYLCSLFINR